MSYQLDLGLIKRKRIEKGLTMEQMAIQLGIESKANYFKRENGTTSFKSTEIPILSTVLGISYEKIFVKTLRKSKQTKEVKA